jgi:hypothetical protein
MWMTLLIERSHWKKKIRTRNIYFIAIYCYIFVFKNVEEHRKCGCWLVFVLSSVVGLFSYITCYVKSDYKCRYHQMSHLLFKVIFKLSYTNRFKRAGRVLQYFLRQCRKVYAPFTVLCHNILHLICVLHLALPYSEKRKFSAGLFCCPHRTVSTIFTFMESNA